LLLQEWLICSLPNFFTYPHAKKSIQFLTLIFMSSTLNLHLLKLFPITLDNNMPDSLLFRLFIVSAKDFYQRLTERQQSAFRDAIHQSTSSTKIDSNLFQCLLQQL
jgi:huntingtin